MQLNKLFSAILGGALLAGAYACTDEVKYNPAPVYDGDEVFFSTELADAISIPYGATSVEVEINRLRSEGELTVGLIGSVTDPEGNDMAAVFSVPSEVTFADGATTATIPVGVDFAEVQPDLGYTLNIAINSTEASPYGPIEASIELMYSAWTEFEPFSTTEFEGVMGSPWTGEPISGIVYYSKSLLDENREEWVFPGPEYSNLYFVYDLYVDKSKTVQVDGLEDGKHAYSVAMPMTDTHFDNDGNRIYYQTAYEFVIGFLAEINNVTDPDQEFIDWAYQRFELKDSYYVPEDGAFHLFLLPFTKEGSLFNDSETLLQLPGFAHYEITFSTKGSFIDADGLESVVVEATRSADLASYAYKVVYGTLTKEKFEQEVAALKADTEATLYVEETRTFLVPLEEEGTYTIVAVGYDAAGLPVYDTSFEFEAESVAKPSDWEKRGICEYTDDLVASLGMDNYTWEVEYEENINTPGFYRLVKPYQQYVEDLGNPDFTYKNGKNYLYIHTEDPTCAYVGESLIGLMIEGMGPWIVTSQADGLLADGATVAQIKSFGMAGTFVDGVFTMPAQSKPIDGQVYSNILWIDEARYGQGWLKGNANGAMRVDFLLDQQSSAPRKAIQPGAHALSRSFVPAKAAWRKSALKNTEPTISKYVKVTNFR